MSGGGVGASVCEGFCPKEVPFSGFSCVKGHGFHQLKYMKERRKVGP